MKGGLVNPGQANIRPSEKYYSQGYQGNPDMFEQQYLQQTMPFSQQQPMYPQTGPFQQQPMYPQIGPFQQQQQVFNPLQQQQIYNPLLKHEYEKQLSYLNKSLEMRSKLSFYVNIELELFPGESVNLLQKSSLLCSSRFERIREAFAKILGIQYVPSAIEEAYAYQSYDYTQETKDKEKEKEKEKDVKDRKGGGSQKNLKLKRNNSIKNKSSVK